MNEAYRSFQLQALHYFQRDHEGVRREPLAVAAAWKGNEVAQRDDWIVRLTPAHAREVEHAVRAARDRGLRVEDLEREDFALPGLAPSIREWARELDDGRGFLLVRGFPVETLGDEDSAYAYWDSTSASPAGKTAKKSCSDTLPTWAKRWPTRSCAAIVPPATSRITAISQTSSVSCVCAPRDGAAQAAS